MAISEQIKTVYVIELIQGQGPRLVRLRETRSVFRDGELLAGEDKEREPKPEDFAALFGQVPAPDDTAAQVEAELRAQLEAKDRSLSEALLAVEAALKRAVTAEDQLRLAGLSAPKSPGRSIHAAWFRAALADMGLIKSVDAAVKTAGAAKWELWSRATEINIDDPSVIEVATALTIDLEAVLGRAIALRDNWNASPSA